MRELVNSFISNIHIFLLVYGLYGGWVMYDEHIVQLEQIQNERPSIEEEITQTEKTLDEIKKFVKKADEYKVRVEEVARNIESVQKQLPSETNDTQILTYIQGELNSLNLKDANFTPGKEETSTYIISKDYNLKAEGTFLQFLIFFERIGNADRIYNIKSLKLSSGSEPQKGRFQMISGEGLIQAYRFNPDFKVERGF